ncbi:MAG: anti-sigma factor domain-containing protein [Actinomycetota bacterium]
MTQDHERIEELLTGYTLLSLTGEDAAEADRILAEHLPSCLTCRQTLSELQILTGDLALAADPVAPPDLVRARIHRGIEDVPLDARRSRRGSFVALAASVAALVAMGGLSFTLAGRASRAEDRTEAAIQLLSVMRSPGADPVRVDPEDGTPAGSGFLGVSAPDVRRLYLVADVCPDPTPDHAYQLWLGAAGSFTPIGEMFVPNADGVVLLELTVDVARYDEIWITEEWTGEPPSTPGTDGRSWRAELG